MKNLKILTRVTLAMAILINSQSSFAESQASKREMMSCKDAAEKLFLENPLYANSTKKGRGDLLGKAYDVFWDDILDVIRTREQSFGIQKNARDMESQLEISYAQSAQELEESLYPVLKKMVDKEVDLLTLNNVTALNQGEKGKFAADIRDEIRALKEEYLRKKTEVAEAKEKLKEKLKDGQKGVQVLKKQLIPYPHLFSGKNDTGEVTLAFLSPKPYFMPSNLLSNGIDKIQFLGANLALDSDLKEAIDILAAQARETWVENDDLLESKERLLERIKGAKRSVSPQVSKATSELTRDIANLKNRTNSEKLLEFSKYYQDRIEITRTPTLVLRKGEDIVGVLDLRQEFGFNCVDGKVSTIFKLDFRDSKFKYFTPEGCMEEAFAAEKKFKGEKDSNLGKHVYSRINRCSMFYKSPQSTTDSQSTPTTGAPK